MPPGRRSIGRMRTFKSRRQFYLPDDLAEALDKLAAEPGASKTSVLTDALRNLIAKRGGNELDERFAPRFDRHQRLLQEVRTTLGIVAEVLDLFVQHQMTIVAHQPGFDDETAQLGLRRYRQFLDQVARRLTKRGGRPRLLDSFEPKGDERHDA